MASPARQRLIRALPWAVCAGALLVVAVGLTIYATGGTLGTWLPPFVMRFTPRVDGHAVVTFVVFAGALAVAPVTVARIRSRVWFAVWLYLLSLALGLSLNLAHRGVRGWWAMFATGSHGTFEGHFEYLLGLPLLRHGVGYFLRHFATLLPQTTTHVKGNPPGPLIALHLLGVHTAAGLAALCVIVGSVTAPLAYDLGRTVGGEQRGRLAGLLAAFTPALLLFGVSSVDYTFAALGMGAACLLARPGWAALVAGAAVAALGTFGSWLLFAIPAWSALLALQRAGWRRAVWVGGACLVAVVVLNGALALAYGYDPFSALSATASDYGRGAAVGRPYLYWVVGSPTAWAVMVGLPVIWLSLRALVARDPVGVALWALIAAASVLGLTKAETERIWLPFAPLACVAASAALPALRLRPLLVALAAQAVAIELLFFTIW